MNESFFAFYLQSITCVPQTANIFISISIKRDKLCLSVNKFLGFITCTSCWKSFHPIHTRYTQPALYISTSKRFMENSSPKSLHLCTSHNDIMLLCKLEDWKLFLNFLCFISKIIRLFLFYLLKTSLKCV